ncbi:MAG: tetratricopeptide repeat protein [Verrucomicrobiales bacterium]
MTSLNLLSAQFSRPFFNCPILLAVVIGTILGLLPHQTLHAQAADAAFETANRIFDTGDFAAASEALQDFVENYPTSPLVFAGRLRLAYALFFSQEFEAAMEQLNALLEPNAATPAEVRALADGLKPQITAARASQEEDSAKQEELFKEAITQFTAYIDGHATAADLDQAFYGRALSRFQVQEFDIAAQELATSLERFPRSSMLRDTQYLRALALTAAGATQAVAEGFSVEVGRDFDAAEALLQGLIQQQEDLSLRNDAILQLGELFLNRASLTSDQDNQPALYEKALEFFRQVEPSGQMIQAQQQRLEAFRRLVAQARQQANLAEINRLNNQVIPHEQRKLSSLEDRPDQKLSALLRKGEVFYRTAQWDALRVLMSFLAPFSEDPETDKQIKYYTAISYAGQTQIDQALAAYQAFQEQYKGDPIAENLPLFMGNMYLEPPNPNPEQAIAFLREAREIYPESQFEEMASLQEARALLGLGRPQESADRFAEIIQEESNSPAGRLTARLGLAQSQEALGELDTALASYAAVRQEHANTPEAEQAHFQTIVVQLNKGDAASAEREARSYLEEYPESTSVPNAEFLLAQSLQSLGRPDDAIAVFKRFPTLYGDSPLTPFTYFQIASIYASQQQNEEMVEPLQTFVDTYPEHPQLFLGYDSLGTTLFQLGRLEEAVAAYEGFAEVRPTDAETPAALMKAMEYLQIQAESLGRYMALNEEERAVWTSSTEHSERLGERIVREFGESPQTPAALQGLLAIQSNKVQAELIPREGIAEYFRALAESVAETPSTQSKVLFTLAAYLAPSQREEALAIMSSAYNPELIFSPPDLELYGLLLIEEDNLDDARGIFEKLATDYPLPADLEPQQAPPDVQAAQSGYLFGLGRLAQAQDDPAAASSFFSRLQTMFPGSPKALEADIGIAEGLIADQNYEEVLTRVSPIIASPFAPGRVRAMAYLLGGHAHRGLGDAQTAVSFYDGAVDFFPEIEDVAAESLLEAGKLLQQLGDVAQARIRYEKIVSDYSAMPEVEEARARLGQ